MMVKWRSAVFISVLLHVGLLFLLSTYKAPMIKATQSPPIKAYMVSLPVKPKVKPKFISKATPKKETASANEKHKQTQSFGKAKSPQREPLATTMQKVAQLQKAQELNSEVQKATAYKKINLQRGLKSILQKQPRASSAQQAATTNAQPERVTVPKAHSQKVKPLLKIEKQNMQFTTYRRGDSCFKKVSIGAGVMPKNDLPDSYFTAPQPCDKTKLTEAYDTAMGKWLNKK